MELDYYICDVFTNRQFGGNQLAVIPDSSDLDENQMQAIAREFNFSETTFVLPSEKGNTRRVRIFTPATEVPFAGHPNVGTAFILATTGELDDWDESLQIVFEEKAGLVPVEIRRSKSGQITCELEAPEKLSLGKTLPVDILASALGLTPADFILKTHAPQVVSVGLPFLMAELADVDALGRVKVNLDGFESIRRTGIMPDIHLYVREENGSIRCRMFAPLDGVMEDPATGSANAALAGLLSLHEKSKSGSFSFKISQGVEMGRPSTLRARTEKVDGTVTGTWIGGTSVLVSKGILFLS